MSQSIRLLPAVDARALDGTEYRLPNELGGERNLIAVAFQRNQQDDVDTWLGDFAALEDQHDGLITYEMPTISRRWAPVRGFIDGGMTAAIPDPKTRARTITAYTDVNRVRDSLGLPDTNQIAVIVCDRDGVVSWLARGARSDEAAAELRAALSG
ncbi:unannotated protein [freshwater metagenome]|uniref:Unannotated protein n=1 Tax=freshwater metagenome TaxID=449393 RepID=A0A6J5ZGL3_9ZZZZ|nr:hypothetical protein [Actinomycetota bacterium]